MDIVSSLAKGVDLSSPEAHRRQREFPLKPRRASPIDPGTARDRLKIGQCRRRPGALRPGLAAVALELARLMDNPRAVNQHAAAAKVLARLLDELASASARGRRGNLSLVKSMTMSPPPA